MTRPGRKRQTRNVREIIVAALLFTYFHTAVAYSQPRVVALDGDEDCDVDQADYQLMSGCLTGPGGAPMGSNCPSGGYDTDDDDDVDLEDVAILQQHFGSSIGLSPRLKWSMPDRFGVDANDDGLIDYLTTNEAINPASWRVDFDACASCGAPDSFLWTINGSVVGERDECNDFFWYFPAEGVFEVGLTVRNKHGSESISEQVLVKDWLIIGLGDSYGSGEGNPDVPIAAAAFDTYDEAVAWVADARAALGLAELDLADASSAFAELTQRLDEASARLDAWLQAVAQVTSACRNPLSSACHNAIADEQNRRNLLLASLNQLGLGHLSGNSDAIRNAIAELRAQAQANLDLARAVADDATAQLAGAEAAVTEARTHLRPVWQDDLCHRSALSGQAIAALRLERSDPHSSVTFVHLACSGATIDHGLMGSQLVTTDAGQVAVPPQLETLAALAKGREIDAVLVSIGGNDVHFASIVEGCIVQEPCSENPTNIVPLPPVVVDGLCAQGSIAPFSESCENYFQDLLAATSSLDLFEQGIAALPKALGNLSAAIQKALPAVRPKAILVTFYPDISTDELGGVCTYDPSELLRTAPGISFAEMRWAGDVLTPRLNGALATAGDREGWSLVSAIFERFSGHGYCSEHGWFVRLQNTFRIQGDVRGAFHPNQEGHEAVGEAILGQLKQWTISSRAQWVRPIAP